MVDDDTREGDATRRRFLRTSSGLATAGIVAGCSGGGGDGGGSGDGGGGGGDDGDGGDGDERTTTEGVDFPDDTIKFIVPFGPGGGFDFYTRLVAKYLAKDEYLGVQTKVKNVEGSGGIIGGNEVATSEPNGYTLGIWYPPGFASSQITRPDTVKYDLTTLTPLPSTAGTTRALAVREGTGIKTFQGFIEAARAGEIKFAATGPLTHTRKHITALAKIAGLFDWEDALDNFVYFDGKGPWFTAMKRGDVDMMAGSHSSLLPFAEEELRIILVYVKDEKPPEQTPDAQTLADVDIPNLEEVMSFISSTPVYRVFAGPPDIPDERAEILQNAIMEALQDPDLKAEAKEADRPVNPQDSDTVDKWLDRYVETQKKYKDLIETLKNRS